MTPLEQRLRAAARDAFPPTPDLAAGWAANATRQVAFSAQGRRRRWLVAALAALVLPAAALALPAVRDWLGISTRVRVRTVPTLPPPAPPPSGVTTLHRGGATVTLVRGRYIVKNVTPETRVRRVSVGGAHGVYLTGGEHQLAIARPDGRMIPLDPDRGDALVYERRGVVVRIDGAGSLGAARRIAAAATGLPRSRARGPRAGRRRPPRAP